MSTAPTGPTPSTEGEPPHAPLPGYYGSDAERSRYVVDLFDRTVRHSNTIEALLLNGGLWYRYFCLRRAGLGRGMKVLDVAIGTAAVARGAVRLVGSEGKVFGVDPSRGMLAEAKKNFSGPLTRGQAESLPFASDSFDFVTMGIALRHVSDLRATFPRIPPGARARRHAVDPGGARAGIARRPSAHAFHDGPRGPRNDLALHRKPRSQAPDGLLLGHGRAECPTADDPRHHGGGRLRRDPSPRRIARVRVHRPEAALGGPGRMTPHALRKCARSVRFLGSRPRSSDG